MLVVMFFDGVFVYMREFVKIFDVEEVEIIYCKFLQNEEEVRFFFGDLYGDGVLLMFFFGYGYFIYVMGLMYKENGFCDVYIFEVYDRFVRRFYRKIEQNRYVYEKYEEYFMDDVEIFVVSWGVMVRLVFGVVLKVREEGIKVGLFVFKIVYLFLGEWMRVFGKKVWVVFVLEMNFGQMILEVQRYVNDDVFFKGVNKIGGVFLMVNEIFCEIRGVV